LAVQPGGADDVAAVREGLQDGLFAGELGAAVGAARGGGGVLGVRRGGVAGEDVVGGDVEQDGAGTGAGVGEVGRAVAVDRERLGLAGLGVVHGGPGRAVDDHGGPVALERAPYGVGVREVQRLPVEGGDLLTRRRQPGQYVPAEH